MKSFFEVKKRCETKKNTYSAQKHEWGTDAAREYAQEMTPGESRMEEGLEESMCDWRKSDCRHDWKTITMNNGDPKFSLTQRCTKFKATRKINPKTGRAQRR